MKKNSTESLYLNEPNQPYLFNNRNPIFLKMKLLSILMFAGVFSVSANSYSQKTNLNLTLRNTSITEAISKIESSSDFIFIYDAEILNNTNKVNLNIKSKSIEYLLDQLLAGIDVKYLIDERQVFIYKKDDPKILADYLVNRLPKQVKGTIKDKQGLPIQGATVTVKGTKIAVTTDANGSFIIEIPNDAKILVVSFIGMETQELAVTENVNLNVVMAESSIVLDEIVTVALGYGVTTTREKITGSIATVNPKQLMDRGAVTTPLGLLTGLATNVRVTAANSLPGTSPVIQIREVSSWKTGGDGVLFVIDGVIRDQEAFQALNPNDIENLSILKDAASAAIYGMKAGDGVVLVTTKMGKRGKLTINYGFSYASSDPILNFKKMNAYDYALKQNMWSGMIGRAVNASEWYLPYELDYFKNNSFNALNDFWSNPRSTNHNISAGGGTESVRYFVSGSFNTTDQASLGVGYDKNTLLAKIENKIGKRLTLNFRMSASWDKTSRPAGDIQGGGLNFGTLITRPAISPYYKTIDGVTYPMDPSVASIMLGKGGYSKYDNAFINPMASISYTIPGIEGLSASAQYAVNSKFSKSKQYNVSPEYYNFIFDRHIPTDNFDFAGSRGWKTRNAQGNNTYASLTQNYGSGTSYQGNYQLNYARVFDKHRVSAFGGYEFRGSEGDFIQAYRRGYALESFDQISGGSSDINNQQTSGDITAQEGMGSWIGRLDYSFSNKYILGATIRRDGSYKFAPDQRWGNFPAVSAAWIVSKESFFDPLISVFSSLKIRGSWGVTGTDRTNPWQWRETFVGGTQGSLGNNIFPTIGTSVVPNPLITWEKNSNYNLGLDFGMMNNALTFRFEGWYKKTTDILSNRLLSTPSVVGAALPDVNYGVMSARGLEFTTDYQSKIGKLNFSVGGNISYNENKILVKDQPAGQREYDNEVGFPSYRIRAWNILVNKTGKGVIRTVAEAERLMAENAVGATYYRTAGTQIQPGMVYAQDKRGSNNTLAANTPDGNVNQDGPDDRQWIPGKYGSPRINFGLNITAEYNGLELNAIAAGTGAHWRGWDRGLTSQFQLFTDFWPNEWTSSNINGDPSPLYSGAGSWPGGGTDKVSTLNIYNMGFLRVKNISLAYNIPTKLTKKVGIERFKVYMNMENPFMIYKLAPRPMDPESAETVIYPILRSYSLGFNVTL